MNLYIILFFLFSEITRIQLVHKPGLGIPTSSTPNQQPALAMPYTQHIYIYTFIQYIYIYVYTFIQHIYIYIYIHMYTTYIYIHIHTHLYNIYIYTYTFIQHIYIYICIHICMYIYIYIYIYIRAACGDLLIS